jgi:hypothetical protein
MFVHNLSIVFSKQYKESRSSYCTATSSDPAIVPDGRGALFLGYVLLEGVHKWGA